MFFNGNKNTFSIFLNTINCVWGILYWNLSLFPPSLRYWRPGYLRSGNFRLFVFELYFLILILNHEKVTVIVINKLNHYYTILFAIVQWNTLGSLPERFRYPAVDLLQYYVQEGISSHTRPPWSPQALETDISKVLHPFGLKPGDDRVYQGGDAEEDQGWLQHPPPARIFG